MRRLKRRLRREGLTACSYLKRAAPIKDREGNVIPQFEQEKNIKAEIWKASGRTQLEMYGQRIIRIKNMLYQGNEVISEGDRIEYHGELYEVISVSGTEIQKIEMEKVT